MYEILKLNEISEIANEVFTSDYKLIKEDLKPDGIILRSFNMLDYPIKPSVLCVGRAGAGTNNIPIEKCTEKGIVVFNTPGANANAVKELVICGLLLASRKIVDGVTWAKTLKGEGDDVAKLVEKGKSTFAGPEIYKKTLGVIGLGAIGAMVANTAISLGMNVLGYDPFISIDGAWNLDNNVKREQDINAIFKKCDYITLHVPLKDATRAMINDKTIANMKNGVAILNFARGELVDNKSILKGIKSGKISRYVTDFPSDDILCTPGVVALPHLGASTPEAEDNCAVMVARQMIDFIENGNITNSVNMPACQLPRQGKQRVTIIHRNVKNVLNSITNVISAQGANIANMMSQAKGDYAYLILDLDEKIPATAITKLVMLENIIKVRVIAPPPTPGNVATKIVSTVADTASKVIKTATKTTKKK